MFIFRTSHCWKSLGSQGRWFQFTLFYRREYVKGRCIFNPFPVNIINMPNFCFNTHPYFVTCNIFKELNICSFWKTNMLVYHRRGDVPDNKMLVCTICIAPNFTAAQSCIKVAERFKTSQKILPSIVKVQF